MKVNALRNSIKEAERFIEIAKLVKIKTLGYKKYECVEDYTKESAACKRASMDLTRALAQLRK